jgi:hypothetical protein
MDSFGQYAVNSLKMISTDKFGRGEDKYAPKGRPSTPPSTTKVQI